MTTDTLTKKQALFVQEFLIDMNGTQAALRSGYSPRTANRIASENLSKPLIIGALQTAMNARAKRTELKADDIVKGFMNIAFTDVRDVLEWTGKSVTLKSMDDISDAAHAAIAEISETTNKDSVKTIRVKLHNKVSALDSLGKHLPGFFSSTTKHEVEVSGTVHHESSLKHYSLQELDALLAAMDAEEKPTSTALAAPESDVVDADYAEVSDDDNRQGEQDDEARMPDAPESDPIDATFAEIPFDPTNQPYKPSSQHV